jgi:hypothetical protein
VVTQISARQYYKPTLYATYPTEPGSAADRTFFTGGVPESNGRDRADYRANTRWGATFGITLKQTTPYETPIDWTSAPTQVELASAFTVRKSILKGRSASWKPSAPDLWPGETLCQKVGFPRLRARRRFL